MMGDIVDMRPAQETGLMAFARYQDLERAADRTAVKIKEGFMEMGYKVGGFDAYITSNVISAAGVSSSAAFEMLLCSMLNVFFNEGKMDVVAYAHVGKYSENHYWNKSSGLLDQMACAVGGLITIDFLTRQIPRWSRSPLISVPITTA